MKKCLQGMVIECLTIPFEDKDPVANVAEGLVTTFFTLLYSRSPELSESLRKIKERKREKTEYVRFFREGAIQIIPELDAQALFELIKQLGNKRDLMTT